MQDIRPETPTAGVIEAAFTRYECERRERAEAVVEWGRRNAAPKIRGQFQRVFEDLILKSVFRSLSRKAAENFDWAYRHHIDWEPGTTRDLRPAFRPTPGAYGSLTLESMLTKCGAQHAAAHSTAPPRSADNKEQVMRIGSSIFLIALGAILAWAVAPGLIPFIDQVMVGYILMAVGVIGLIASLILASPGRSRRVSETRSVVDPNTGERITRNESRDGGI